MVRFRRVRNLALSIVSVILVSGCASASLDAAEVLTNSQVSANTVGEIITRSEDFSVLVVGDDSGKSAGGWVFLMAQKMARKYGKRVELSDVRFDTSRELVGVSEPLVFPVGDSQRTGTIRVTNWSVPWPASQIADTVSSVAGAVPVPDLILVSYGYPAKEYRTLGRAAVSLEKSLYASWPSAEIVFISQPNDGNHLIRFLNQQDLAVSVGNLGVQILNVENVFAEFKEGEETLFADSGYPNIDGFRVWSGAVMSQLDNLRMSPR